MRFTDFINQINESKDFETELVFEDETSDPQQDARDRRSGAAIINMSLADLYDMTGQPYPLVEDPNSRQLRPPPGFFERRDIPIGTEEGMLAPEIGLAVRSWQNSGSPIGASYDVETGELRSYADNPILLDLGYQLASSTVGAVGDIGGGILQIADFVASYTTRLPETIVSDYMDDGKFNENWMRYDLYHGARNLAEQMGANGWAEALAQRTDQEWRDDAFLFANAVNDVGDIAGLAFGNTFNDLSWQGLFAITAAELPSELITALPMLTGVGGVALTAGLNAAEALGAARAEITQSIAARDEAGEIRGIPAYERTRMYATEELRLRGIAPDSPEYEGQVHQLTLDMMGDATFSRIAAGIAGSGAVLDTIGDRFMLGRIGPKAMRNVTGRLLLNTLARISDVGISSAAEGVDEAFEQLLINYGLITETGDPRAWHEGLVNSAWNGLVVGAAMGTGFQGTQTVVNAIFRQVGDDETRDPTLFQQTQARLRRLLFGRDANNIEAVFQIQGTSPEALVNRLVDQETGQVDFTKLIDTSIPTEDELTNSQRRRLTRTGSFTTADGRRISREEMETAGRSRAILTAMNNAVYEPNENRWIIIWNDENAMRDAARLLGVENVDGLSDSDVIRQLESVYNLDMRVPGQDQLEAPSWTALTPQQRSEFLTQGRVTFTGHPTRGNQSWSREEVLYSTRRYDEGDSVPDWVYNVPNPTDARPTVDNSDLGNQIRDLQSQIDNNPLLRTALDNLESDQRDWDEFAAENGEESAIAEFGPRPTGDEEGDPYEITAARASTSSIQARLTQVEQELEREQSTWDSEYRFTHNPDGTPKIYAGRGNGHSELERRQRDAAEAARAAAENIIDQRMDGDAAATEEEQVEIIRAAMDAAQQVSINNEEPISNEDLFSQATDAAINAAQEITGTEINSDDARAAADEVISSRIDSDYPQNRPTPEPVPVNSNLARARVVYGASLRVAQGDMDPLEVASMIDRLEQHYPGIEQEIFGDAGIESYVQNPAEVSEEVDTRIQEEGIEQPTPETVENAVEPSNGFDPRGVQRPPTGTEIERDGETYRFLGRMWAPVNPDGTIGSTGAVSTELQTSLRDEWAENTIMSQPVGQTAPDVQTDVTDLEGPEVPTDSEITPSDVDTPPETGESPSGPEAPELEQIPDVPDTTDTSPDSMQTDVTDLEEPEVPTDSEITPSDEEPAPETDETPTGLEEPETDDAPTVDSEIPEAIKVLSELPEGSEIAYTTPEGELQAGEFVGFEDETIIIKDQNGNRLEIPQDNVSPQRGAQVDSNTPVIWTPGEEIRLTDQTTNIDIDGTFEGFKDGNIEIRTPEGLQELEFDSNETPFVITRQPASAEVQQDIAQQPTPPEVPTDSEITPRDVDTPPETGEAPSAPEAPELDSTPTVDTDRFTPIDVTQVPNDPFRDTTTDQSPEGDEQQRQDDVETDEEPQDTTVPSSTDPRGREQLADPREIEPEVIDQSEIDTAVSAPTTVTTPAEIVSTVATPTTNANNKRNARLRGGVGGALQNMADDAVKWKAIQVYDPLQLRRSERFLNK